MANTLDNTGNVNNQPNLLRTLIYDVFKLKKKMNDTPSVPIDTVRILKASIKIDNGGNVVSSLDIFKNTLNNTNPFVVSQIGTGQYSITSVGAFTGSLYRRLTVSALGNTKLDIIKLNNNTILLVNRNVTSSQMALDISSGTQESFEFELY